MTGFLGFLNAQTFVGKVSGIKSEEPFNVPDIKIPVFAERTFNVKDFGAQGDSVTNDTRAINEAIARCNAAGGGSVTFPAGCYMAASIHLKSNVCLKLDEKAEIFGASSGYDAPESHSPNEKYQDYGHSHFHNALMWGEDIENFAIIGGKVTGGAIIQNNPNGRDIGDKVIAIVRGKNLLFKNVTHNTGGHFVYLLNDCENITIDHVVIKKSRDAIDFMGCRNVQVFGCYFTGCSDDTIGIKSDYVLGRRILSENFYVWDCYFESGCNGLQFGSETAGDFRNIRIWSVKIGLAMKAGIGITSNDSGNIDDVMYRDIEISNAASPIFILITDRLRTGEAGVKPGKISNVTLKNITITKQREGSHHGPVSTATVSGLPGYTIDNLTLENVRITYAGGGKTEDAAVVPPYLKEYSPNQYKTRPAAALFARHVKGLTLKNVVMDYETPDYRPPLVIWDADGVTLSNFSSSRPDGVAMIHLKDVRNLNVQNSTGIQNTKNETIKEGKK
ncbi:MAG: glycosyl hydrolase family 28-related protein [Bacteroidota bacterium]|nr:glycosyl hydrolase family 28-related protein [Bacteroidota bacterium]